MCIFKYMFFANPGTTNLGLWINHKITAKTPRTFLHFLYFQCACFNFVCLCVSLIEYHPICHKLLISLLLWGVKWIKTVLSQDSRGIRVRSQQYHHLIIPHICSEIIWHRILKPDGHLVTEFKKKARTCIMLLELKYLKCVHPI